MASNAHLGLDLGYDEERFITRVSRNFHCLICFNVLKDPVMCRKNQHCFCRDCITQHLHLNAPRCPTCADELTVDTLSDAPRMVKEYLSELQIHCDYSDRGCQELVQLQKLKPHIATCGFKPIVCANQGCGVTVNRRDRIHHESALCEFRKFECSNCGEMSKMMAGMLKDAANAEMRVATVETRMTNLETNMTKEENMETRMANVEINMGNMEISLSNVEKNVATLRTNVETNMAKLARNNERENFTAVNNEVRELKMTLTEVKYGYDSLKETVLGAMTRQQEEMTRQFRATDENGEKEQNIIVAGGAGVSSVEMLNVTRRLWSVLQPMETRRFEASAFVYDNHVTIVGGHCSGSAVDHMIQMKANPTPDPLTHWSDSTVKLPGKLAGHSSVLYNDRLFVSGGWSAEEDEYSDCIHEVQLQPPYSVKLVSKLPEPRRYHRTEVFDDNILILGGRKGYWHKDNLSSVVLFDIKKSTCQELPPLPYPVSDMATVKWGGNVVIIGGADFDGKALNTVTIYNPNTGESHMLPPMKHKRRGCAAVIVGNEIVVVGGDHGRRNYVTSVEGFSIDRYIWQDFPPMREARNRATAVLI